MFIRRKDIIIKTRENVSVSDLHLVINQQTCQMALKEEL